MNKWTHFFIKIYLSHFMLERVDVGCVWETSWRRVQTVILTQSSSFGHSSTSSSSWLGCSTVGHWGPKALCDPRAPGYIIVSRSPASTVLPLIYTGVSLDWQLGRGSICYTVKWLQVLLFNNKLSIQHYSFICTIKCFQVLLCITNNSIKHQSFVYIQLNDQTVLFLPIQLSINHLFAHNLNVKWFYLTPR